MTRMPSTSPVSIFAFDSSKVPSVRSTGALAANAARSAFAACPPSWSTQARSYWAPLPEKIVPKRITNTTGNASVQKSAARSRTKLFRLARLSAASMRIVNRRSVAKRAAGEIEEHVLEARPPHHEVRRLGPRPAGQLEERADRRRHVARVQDDLVLL